MITITDLNKSYGGDLILQNINLQIEKGTIYTLLGKNGVGKTTLIHSLIDLLKFDSGSIKINNVANTELTKENKRNLGIVGEDLALVEELNGLSFLKFIGSIYNIPKEDLDKRIKDLFDYFFDNKEDLKKNISKYSTGMKKKIAFCAAIIHTPDILILDEPFSGLDPIVANQMIDFLKQYFNENRIILISSHDLNYVEKITTHIGVLNEANLQFNSTLEDFTTNGENSIDGALLKLLRPNTVESKKMDWI